MTTHERNMKMHKTSGSRVDLYKLIKEYNLLKGNARHPNVQNIIESYDLGLIEEEIRRVQEFIEEIKHDIDERERSVVRERQKDRNLELRKQREFEMDDIEDRLMGRRTRRTRRASDVVQSLNERIARLERTARRPRMSPQQEISEGFLDVFEGANAPFELSRRGVLKFLSNDRIFPLLQNEEKIYRVKVSAPLAHQIDFYVETLQSLPLNDYNYGVFENEYHLNAYEFSVNLKGRTSQRVTQVEETELTERKYMSLESKDVEVIIDMDDFNH